MLNVAKKKMAVVAVVAVLSPAVVYAQTPIAGDCGGMGVDAMNILNTQLLDSLTQQVIEEAKQLIIDKIKATMDTTVAAIKTAVKQESASSEKKILAMRQAAEAFANAAVAAKASERIYDIYNRYRSQGFNVCAASKMATELSAAWRYVDDQVPIQVITKIDSGPGRLGDPLKAQNDRANEHNSLFCTESDIKAKRCNAVGDVPGGDTNAALLFVDVNQGDSKSKAKDAFINNVFGLPVSTTVFQGRGGTPEAQAMLTDKHRTEALNSIAMYSLKSIQAAHERAPGKDKSLSEMQRENVTQYYGNNENSKKWALSLAAQEQRGILIDMLKMEGQSIKMIEQRIRQNSRIEANLAGLVVLANDAVNGQ